MQMKEKNSSGVFSTGGDLAVEETLSAAALQMQMEKGKERGTWRRHKCSAESCIKAQESKVQQGL